MEQKNIKKITLEEAATLLNGTINEVIANDFAHVDGIHSNDMLQTAMLAIISHFDGFEGQASDAVDYFRPFIIDDINSYVVSVLGK